MRDVGLFSLLFASLVGCTGDAGRTPRARGDAASLAATQADQHEPVAAASAGASSAPSLAPAAATTAEPLALFGSEPRVRSLELAGFQPVHLVLPRGDGKGKAKLAVIAHGAGGRPEPHCEHYAPQLGDGFLLACTRGFPSNTHLPEPERGYFYDGHHRLGAELEVLFSTLAEVEPYASGVELSGALYVGFSQGATMGILALHEKPELAARFESILLVDGGSGDWTVALAKRMAERSTRVGIVCGNPTCREKAERARPWLKHAGLGAEMRLITAPHALGGRLSEEVIALWPWLLRTSGD